jgi:threonine/homoserine/homoserine lactone efflux protein
MGFEATIALIIFLFPLAYSPGPGNAFFASIGATHGLQAAIPALLGYHVATFVVTAMIGMGAGLLLLSEPRVARVLTILGAAYVFWLGYLFLKASMQAQASSRSETPVRIGFTDGALILLFNPKAYYIIGLLFTQFLVPPNDGLAAVLNITTIFTLNNLVAFLVWTLAGAAIARLFMSETANRRINILFALCLIGVGIWMLVPIFTT